VRWRYNPPMVTPTGSLTGGLLDLRGINGDDAQKIQEHVARILRSPRFARAPRMQRFLAFLTEEMLAGRASHLKEYTIAVSVFGKPADFDPGTSALVRVEAGRLRKLLAQYRLEDGAADVLIVEIPKGSYIPAFRPVVEPGARNNVTMSEPPGTTVASESRPISPRASSLWSASQELRQITAVSCTFESEVGTDLAGEFVSSFEVFYDKCTAIAKRLGGSLDGGSSDRLMLYFGWPNALEDCAARALTAALELLAAVKESFGGGPLGVRIGIATSAAVTRAAETTDSVSRPGIIGEAPLLATRMLRAVPFNGILVTESTRRLTGASFEFVPAGALDGQAAESSLLWRLLAAKPVATRFRAVHAGPQSAIIGRREELALLLSRWKLSAQGEGQAVVLLGEAGIGKSRVAESVLDEIGAGAVQMRAQCSPHHANSTLYPFVDLIRSQLETPSNGEPASDAQLDRFLARFGLNEPADRTLLSALLSGSTDEVSSALSASQQKDLTLDLLVRLLTSQAYSHPTVLLVEDIHWADPTTVELLEAVLRLSPAIRLLLVLTSRSEPGWESIRQTNITAIRLTRLPRRDCNELIDRMLNVALLSANARALILEKAEGIPLFVEELTRLLLGAGETGAREVLVPESLSDLLVSQLDRLGAIRGVAQMGAVIGRQFTREMLAQACGFAGDDIDTALDQLMAAGILVCEGTETARIFSFRHALLRDAAYGSVLEHSRRKLHYHVGSMLLESFPELAIEHPEIIARHMMDGARPDEAIPFWVDAGRKAAGRYALAEAISDFRLALDAIGALPDSRDNWERELEVQIELGLVTRNARGYGDRELLPIYERARALAAELDRPDHLAHSVYGLWTHAAGCGEWKKAVTLAIEFENLTRRMEDSQLEVEAFRLLGASAALMGEFSIAARHFERALSIYDSERHGPRFGFDPGAVSAAYLAWTLWHLGKPAEARSYAVQALAIAGKKNHAPTLGVVLSWLMFYEVCEGDPAAILAHNERLQSVCAERDCRYWQPFGTACAEWAAFQSDHEARHLDRLLDATRQFRELYFNSCLLLLAADVCAALERPEQGLELTALAAQFIERHDERVWEAECSRRRAQLLLRTVSPDLEEVRRLLMQAMRVARHQESPVLERRSAEALAELQSRLLEPLQTSGRGPDTRH
jgi:class 3 adenylate cyclase